MMRFTSFLIGCMALALSACGQTKEVIGTTSETIENTTKTPAETAGADEMAAETAGADEMAAETAGADEMAAETAGADEMVAETAGTADNDVRLRAVLASQPDEVRARYNARNPEETLKFADIKPGMTVAEVLPGQGWYAKIILPYLGDGGTLVGIDYSVPMWGKFGGFASEEFLDNRKTWAETWTTETVEWGNGNTANVKAFAFGSRPADMDDSVDVVMIVRAFHHLTRFNREFLDEAIADIKAILKPGGSVVIVQHRAPEDSPDDWANGDNGYIKESGVIKIMEEAGFELMAKSEVNANPKDQPTDQDTVWRLPPSLSTSRDNPEMKARMEAIGESDRMALKFRLGE